MFDMQIRIFQIMTGDDGRLQEDMNKFLRGHRVLDIKEHFQDGCWHFCVKYADYAYGQDKIGEPVRLITGKSWTILHLPDLAGSA